MKTNKIKMYIFLIVLVISALSFIFLYSNITKLIFSVLMILALLIAIKLFSIKKRKVLHKKNKTIIIMMLVLGIIYFAIDFAMGIFDGFYKSKNIFSLQSLLYNIIPILTIIITSEYVRYILLNQNNVKKKNIFILVSMSLIDIIANIGLFGGATLNGVLANLGYIVFASISSNILYNFMVKEFDDYIPNVIFRVIITLYPYFIPITPSTYLFLRSFVRFVYPLIVYWFMKTYFAENEPSVSVKKNVGKKGTTIEIIILSVLSLFVIGLISNTYTYGLYVIGSGSMTGEINKGDCIIYEKFSDYETQDIAIGDVIVFNKDKSQIVHRVVEKKKYLGNMIYYTKGDTNNGRDTGYRTNEDIVGKVKFKIPYIGWPTIWLNEAFNKFN